jgi:hypothetical protein
MPTKPSKKRIKFKTVDYDRALREIVDVLQSCPDVDDVAQVYSVLCHLGNTRVKEDTSGDISGVYNGGKWVKDSESHPVKR